LSIIKILLLFWPIFSIDSARNRRNNIILVITDDQDVLLGSLDFMPKTLRLLAQRGVAFPNAFVATPICCPSRSTILSGVYAHNHQVMTNNQRCAGQEWRLFRRENR
jgi:extracellular sulfatase Sulf